MTLFLFGFLIVFAEVVWSYYISNALLQRRYEFKPAECLQPEGGANRRYVGRGKCRYAK